MKATSTATVTRTPSRICVMGAELDEQLECHERIPRMASLRARELCLLTRLENPSIEVVQRHPCLARLRILVRVGDRLKHPARGLRRQG